MRRSYLSGCGNHKPAFLSGCGYRNPITCLAAGARSLLLVRCPMGNWVLRLDWELGFAQLGIGSEHLLLGRSHLREAPRDIETRKFRIGTARLSQPQLRVSNPCQFSQDIMSSTTGRKPRLALSATHGVRRTCTHPSLRQSSALKAPPRSTN
jgi:hypothetical protein